MQNRSHTVSVKSAVSIASKIIGRSKFGLMGEVQVWGNVVVARYRFNKTEVAMQVTFQPAITVEITGTSGSSGKALEGMMLEAENVRNELVSTFNILQVA